MNNVGQGEVTIVFIFFLIHVDITLLTIFGATVRSTETDAVLQFGLQSYTRISNADF